MKKIFKNIKTKIIAASLAVATLMPVVSVNTITHASTDDTYTHKLTSYEIETIFGEFEDRDEIIEILVVNNDDKSTLANTALTDLVWNALLMSVIQKKPNYYTSIKSIVDDIFNNQARFLFSKYNIEYRTDFGFLGGNCSVDISKMPSVGKLDLMYKYSKNNPLSIYNMPDSNLLYIMKDYLLKRKKTNNIKTAIDLYVSDIYSNVSVKNASDRAKIREILYYIFHADRYANGGGYNWKSTTRKYWDHL